MSITSKITNNFNVIPIRLQMELELILNQHGRKGPPIAKTVLKKKSREDKFTLPDIKTIAKP